MLSLDRDIDIANHGESGIAFFSYAKMRVEKTSLIEIRRQVRTGYGTELLPIELFLLVLEKFIVILTVTTTTVIFIIVGSPFRGLVYLGGSRSGGDRVGDSGFRRFRLRRSRRPFLRGPEAVSTEVGNTVFINSATVFIRASPSIPLSRIFFRTLTHFS